MIKYAFVMGLCFLLTSESLFAQNPESPTYPPDLYQKQLERLEEKPKDNTDRNLSEHYEDLSFWPIKRRQSQRKTTTGYVLTPAAANIPGLGFTYGILGSQFNILESEADLFGFKFWGDLSGFGVGTVDVPLGWDPLSINLFWNEFDAAAIDTYRRGMHSDPDDLKRIVFSRVGILVGQLTLQFFEKRLQFHAGLNRQIVSTSKILNKDGDTIAETSGEESHVVNRNYGLILDITDDRSDPRRGLYFETQVYDPPKQGEEKSDTYIIDYNLTNYFPVGLFHTLAVNIYRSDAVIQEHGDTDEANIRSGLNFDCSQFEGNSKQQERCEREAELSTNETLADRKYGTASPLGGTQRLRSFASNRYYAAHAMSLGLEFRFNLTQEFTPFNYIVAGGVRTGMQIATFYEVGTVADLESQLWRDIESSYGLGFRLLIASGFIVRADLAHGSEGFQPTLIFSYPWSVF